MFNRLTDPSAPAAGIADFDAFVDLFAGGVDGLWATMANQVGIVVNPETYRLALKTFRDAAGQDLGETSFADYAAERFGGFWTNKRMPDKAAHIAQANPVSEGAQHGRRLRRHAHRSLPALGRSEHRRHLHGGAPRRSATFTMHVLLGDVILVQPDAYAQVAVRVSA